MGSPAVSGKEIFVNRLTVPRPMGSITRGDLYKFGLKEQTSIMVETIDDLRKSPPHIIIAESLINIHYKQNNNERAQQLVKKQSYVMPMGVYQQMCRDPRNKVTILKPGKVKFTNVYRPYNGEDLTDKSILVWRQGGLGDILFISPNLRYLKNKYPSCKIIFACGPAYQSMVREWPFIDGIVDLPFEQAKLFNANYHVLFEGVIERTHEAERVNAYRLFSRWMGINLPDEDLVPKQIPNYSSTQKVSDILSGWNIPLHKYVVVQLRASSPIRCPRLSIWKKIIDNITDKNINVIITDSKTQKETINSFISTLNNKDKVFNFSEHSAEISDTIALVSTAALVVGVDSSLVHIAESTGVKSFGIYGPFKGELRLGTYKNAKWIDAQATCAPCFKHGNGLCSNSFLGHPRCFDNLNIEDINRTIEGML